MCTNQNVSIVRVLVLGRVKINNNDNSSRIPVIAHHWYYVRTYDKGIQQLTTCLRPNLNFIE